MSEQKYRVIGSFRPPNPKTGDHDWYEPGDTFTGTPGSPLVEELLAGDVNTGPLIELIVEPAPKKAALTASAPKEN